MAENKKGLGLPETRGTFEVTGIVNGTKKDRFYVEKLTSNDKPYRSVNFGVEFQKKANVYVNIFGTEQDEVFFYKRGEDGKKGDTKRIAWKDRTKFDEEGYRLIGVNVGVTKTKDKKGNDVNDRKMLVSYDAAKEVGDNLVDDKSVFVRGNIRYSRYENKNRKNFDVQQVSLCRDVEFDDNEFVPNAKFTQPIVFTGIKKDSESDTPRFIVSAKIITFNTVEDAEFILYNTKLADTMKKNLKPYWGIKVYGDINVLQYVEEVEQDDAWGESNKMDRVNAPSEWELVITGADSESIDKTTYSEAAIDEAIQQMKSSQKSKTEYGKGKEDDDWGNVSGDNWTGEADEDPWN